MSTASAALETLALFNGPRAVTSKHEDLFAWPIVGREDEDAVLDVLRRGAMSGTDVTLEFEREFAEWHGAKYALAHPNGTAALHAALFACGVGRGDEVICPSLTFWASVTSALNLGARIRFCEADPETLCIDPNDIERHITPRTKAIVVVHYCGHPCDMDPIMELANRCGLKVVEDVSHAHGALYKGRVVGTLGHVAGMSLMSGKSLVCGEGGMLLTNDRAIFERAVAWGHYERTSTAFNYYAGEPAIQDPALKRFAGIPLSGLKNRLNQLCAALGRSQLKRYRERMDEIQRAMHRFWDLVEAAGLPGVRAHRPSKASGSTMGGWYYPHGLYDAEKLGGLPIGRFIEALNAEGFPCKAGANAPLHLHPLYSEARVYGEAEPTNGTSPQGPGSLPVTESIPLRCFSVPWFKHDRAEQIERYAAALVKVLRAAHDGQLKQVNA